jgi:hypothetical protein
MENQSENGSQSAIHPNQSIEEDLRQVFSFSFSQND